MTSTGKRLFVIDCDAGLDDAQAILMALAAPDVQVVAITTTHGNVGVDQVSRNVLRLLKVAGRLDIPVYKGAAKSLVGKQESVSFYHGEDGFGDVPDADQPSDSLIKPQHAVTALLELAETYMGELTLVCLGPLTNIALALRLDPEFGSKLKDCFVMGGNYKGEGNVTTSAEFNFHSDPEAAKVTLDELGCHITLATWELCKQHSLSWDWRGHFGSCPSPIARFIDRLETATIETVYKKHRPKDLYGTADQMTMGSALAGDTLVKKVVQVYCTVETGHGLTQGQMVVDWDGKLGRQANVKLILDVDHGLYGRLIRAGLLCSCDD